MAGRKEFLLGNVPNRICHNARCTVIIVNTVAADGQAGAHGGAPGRRRSAAARAEPRREPHLTARGAQIARGHGQARR